MKTKKVSYWKKNNKFFEGWYLESVIIFVPLCPSSLLKKFVSFEKKFLPFEKKFAFEKRGLTEDFPFCHFLDLVEMKALTCLFSRLDCIANQQRAILACSEFLNNVKSKHLSKLFIKLSW